MSTSVAELHEGAQVGRYLLLAKLATGGMADVWLARATGASGFQKTVVLKTILPQFADNPEFVGMFVNEALLASALDHPNIVHIFDLGTMSDGYFIAMEYIAGRTFRQIQMELRRTRRVPPPWLVLHVAAAVCDALNYAHDKCDEQGRRLHVVHRDVTPENIMVAFAGDTKVLDFGIAKASSATSPTKAGTLKGKSAYMAPEQITATSHGAPADPRSDVYSLGVVMYEMLTGHRPFRADNDLALLKAILETEPLPPSEVASWVAPPVEQIVVKAMHKKPEARFQTAAEMRAAIDQFLVSSSVYISSRHVAAYMCGLFGEQTGGVIASHASSARGAAPSTGEWESLSGVRPDTAVSPDLGSLSSSNGAAPPSSAPSPRPLSVPAVRRNTQPVPVLPGREPSSNPVEVVSAADPVKRAASVWDKVMARARHEKDTPNDSAPEPEPIRVDASESNEMHKTPHDWDAVVQRVRKAPDARPDLSSPESRAREMFEKGLTALRAHDQAGALEAWMQALEIDPDNRLIRSNLRVLHKQLAEGGEGGHKVVRR